MKKLTILASALLFTSAAYAQGPTNTYTGQAVRSLAAPANPNATNAPVSGASAGSYNTNYSAYSQDSYINQAGSNNQATVDQSDARTPGVNGGSTAIADQTGNNNTAFQTQSSSNTPYSGATYNGSYTGARDYAKTTQAGNGNQSNQTQSGGVYNRMTVTQGVGTTGNRAIQTQSLDATGNSTANQAVINQTQYNGAGGSGNRAEQTQSGILETAQIDQQSTNSFAKQTQSGGTGPSNGNSANIQQGAPGVGNTAQQTQNGQNNAARISQSVGAGNAGNTNYALQNQTMVGNQADIIQRSSNNYAEQQQSGLAGGGHNYSIMTQSGGPSAALSVQTGNSNSAFVTQH